MLAQSAASSSSFTRCVCHDCKQTLENPKALQEHFAQSRPCTVCDNFHKRWPKAAPAVQAGAGDLSVVRKYCNLAAHRLEAKHILCTTCNCWYFDQARLDKHLNDGTVMCFVCTKAVCFTTLALHCRMQHLKAKHECAMQGCPQHLVSEDDVEPHLEQAHFCSRCDQSFLNKSLHECTKFSSASDEREDEFAGYESAPDEWSAEDEDLQRDAVLLPSVTETKRDDPTVEFKIAGGEPVAHGPDSSLPLLGTLVPVCLTAVPSASQLAATVSAAALQQRQEEIIGQVPVESKETASSNDDNGFGDTETSSLPKRRRKRRIVDLGDQKDDEGQARDEQDESSSSSRRPRKCRRIQQTFAGGNWVTIKCAAHRGAPVSRQILRSCRACRKFPGRGSARGGSRSRLVYEFVSDEDDDGAGDDV
jgi:hypothetical protein